MPIEVKHLTHVYMADSPFEMKALDDVSLEIRDGEFVGIIGHTGSGKSTLIAHMNALERSAPGCVFLNGVDLGGKAAPLAQVRRSVGLVFQYPEYQLFEESVEKDVGFGPKNLGLDADEIARRVRRALRMVGLDEAIGPVSPFNLSGGQKRRVAIAGVLAMEPGILILDEPAAGLDPAGRTGMLELIDGVHKSGVTVVMVSHSMDDVGRYCSRLIVLNRGRVAFEGTPAEVFRHADALREMGLDVPECARLTRLLREKGFEIDADAYTAEAVLAQILKNIRADGGAKC